MIVLLPGPSMIRWSKEGGHTNHVLIDVAILISSWCESRTDCRGRQGLTSLYNLIAFNLNSSTSSFPIAGLVPNASGMALASALADVDAHAILPIRGICVGMKLEEGRMIEPIVRGDKNRMFRTDFPMFSILIRDSLGPVQ